MDARAWRGLAVSFALFGGVGLVFLIGAKFLGADTARHWLMVARGPWALPVAVCVFALLAFLGVPQFVLIAAAVVAFGPWLGSIYSWVGTMASALVGFSLGKVFGLRMFAVGLNQSLKRFVAQIARNGLMASLVVRLVPFAPFVLVNMAAGMSAITLFDFSVGTGLGILPKIALTAFAGSSAMHGGWVSLLMLIGAVGVWLAAGLMARRWLRRPAG